MLTAPEGLLPRKDRDYIHEPIYVQANTDRPAAYDHKLANSLSKARVAHQAVEKYLETKQELEAQDLAVLESGDPKDKGLSNRNVQIVASRTKNALQLAADPGQELVHNTSGLTIQPRKASIIRKLAHSMQKRKPVSGDTPRYWDCLDALSQLNKAPGVADVYYTVPRAFDSPFEGEPVYDRGGLEATSARAIKGFYVTATVDNDGVSGHSKLVHLTFMAKRAGAEIWAFDGLERREIKASVLNSSVPSRLKPYVVTQLPVGIVDVVITADRGFYFRAQRKGQKVDLDVVVPAGTPIPRATSWNQERSDYKEPLLESLCANATGFHSRTLRMRMVDKPGTPIAYGIRELDWMQNTQREWLAKVYKPLDVVGGRPSVLNSVAWLYKEWQAKKGTVQEFMYR
jgi:hypothetical protein